MSHPGTLYMSVNCFCTPPKTLVTDEAHQSARCEDCGCEILTGVLAEGPRLRLVELLPEVEEGDPQP